MFPNLRSHLSRGSTKKLDTSRGIGWKNIKTRLETKTCVSGKTFIHPIHLILAQTIAGLTSSHPLRYDEATLQVGALTDPFQSKET